MSYKKGDLVRHKLGYVAQCINVNCGDDYVRVTIPITNNPSIDYLTGWWPLEDCKPYVDPTPVIEAVKKACAEWNTEMEYPSTSIVGNIIKAFQAYDSATCEASPAPADDLGNFKWLAMDNDVGCEIREERPVWDEKSGEWCGQYGEYIYDNPDWCKPGQLWERGERASLPDGHMIRCPEEWTWRGYWWRLVADHSKEFEGKQPVNADLFRAVTEFIKALDTPSDDFVPGEYTMNLRKALANSTPVEPQEPFEVYWEKVIVLLENKGIGRTMLNLFYEAARGAYCSSTPPQEQPECGTCEHHRSALGRYCREVDCWDPHHGMPGCVYKRRKDDE
jgi:hypothetical protein